MTVRSGYDSETSPTLVVPIDEDGEGVLDLLDAELVGFNVLERDIVVFVSGVSEGALASVQVRPSEDHDVWFSVVDIDGNVGSKGVAFVGQPIPSGGLRVAVVGQDPEGTLLVTVAGKHVGPTKPWR